MELLDTPDKDGFYGSFGGAFVPDVLKAEFEKITAAFLKYKDDSEFNAELNDLYAHYVGRPSPVYFAKNLSRKYGTDIYLKREDLNHTGAHKINHCLGEALLAKRMGKKKIIAETGAGQHGVALATAAALVGLECDIYMGAVDVAKEKPNVDRMQLLGAKVISVASGTRTLKDAVDAAFEVYVKTYSDVLYAIGSVVGPHPFPMMVECFQSIVGKEARVQFKELTGNLPECVVACVGGGSNALGIFNGFLHEPSVALFGVEPLGKGTALGSHAASITYGKEGILHGFKNLVLQDEQGNVADAYSIASGLDYPGVRPKHCYLKTVGRVCYDTVSDDEALDAFYELSQTEGIIPALESAHAVAYAVRLAKEKKYRNILVNLSGRGDKDVEYVLGLKRNSTASK